MPSEPPRREYTRIDVLNSLHRGELPGQAPLKDWEDESKMNVEVNIYGWQGQHARARLHFPKDDDYESARVAALYMIFDFKHTKPWLCEFCGEPARETQFEPVPYITLPGLPICRMPVYIHHVCDMDKPSCQAALKAAHDRINDEHCGIMGPHPPPMRKPPGEIYPLSASCAKCKTDASAGADMKRCSACKMTRYCG